MIQVRELTFVSSLLISLGESDSRFAIVSVDVNKVLTSKSVNLSCSAILSACVVNAFSSCKSLKTSFCDVVIFKKSTYENIINQCYYQTKATLFFDKLTELYQICTMCNSWTK